MAYMLIHVFLLKKCEYLLQMHLQKLLTFVQQKYLWTR